MKTYLRRILALITCLAMVLTLAPASLFAGEEESLQQYAAEHGLAIVQTEAGYTLVPQEEVDSVKPESTESDEAKPTSDGIKKTEQELDPELDQTVELNTTEKNAEPTGLGAFFTSLLASPQDEESTNETPTCVAKINDEEYKTLEAAIDAVQSGETITVLHDIALASTVYVGKGINLDLGEKTVTSTASPAFWFYNGESKISNGTITANGTFTIKVDSTGTNGKYPQYSGSPIVNLADDVVVENTATNGVAVMAVGKSILNTKAELITRNSEDDPYAVLQGNGKAGYNGTEINILGGKIHSTNSNAMAIYVPQLMDLNISGGTITGSTGIYAKAGSITVTGGKISGTGEYAEPVPNGNGADSTGDAVILDSKNGYSGNNANSVDWSSNSICGY